MNPISSTTEPIDLDEAALDGVVAEVDSKTIARTAESKRISQPATVTRKIMWPYLIAFVALHAALPLMFMPYFFSWTGLLLVPLGNYIFCSIGIGLCFHRALTHQGLIMPKWLERTTAVLGVCCLQDTPARWVMIHRIHHQHSDRQPDPHSPWAGFFWGHFGWLVWENKFLNDIDTYDRYVRDILRDRFYMVLERNLLWLWVWVAHAALFYVGGFAVGYVLWGGYDAGLQFGASMLLWGAVVRTVYSWHVTWAVNSVAHMWGYRSYETTDDSRNNWLVALTTNGEGWHNNHHADQRSAAHGHRWWELDITYLTICFLEKVGLAKDVVRPRRRRAA